MIMGFSAPAIIEKAASDLHMKVRVSTRPTPNTPNRNELHT